MRSDRNVSLDLAKQIAAATVAACQANGYAVSAAGGGGDPGGHLEEQCAVAAIDEAKELLK